MTKRNSNFEENPPKKSKLVVDDLWGDDLNAEDIDDCLLRATQVYQQVICFEYEVLKCCKLFLEMLPGKQQSSQQCVDITFIRCL